MNELLKPNPSQLAEMAISAAQSAYAPYSKYKVGAALLCKNGNIYTGCNIENASYTPTVCAERVAFFKAISAGDYEFEAIAVAGGYNGKIEGIFPPCGVCRQVMAEFCSKDFIIYLCEKDKLTKVSLYELLPYSFSSENMQNNS